MKDFGVIVAIISIVVAIWKIAYDIWKINSSDSYKLFLKGTGKSISFPKDPSVKDIEQLVKSLS